MDKVKRSVLKRFTARYLLKYYIFWLYNFDRGKLKKNLLNRKEKDGPKCADCGLCCLNCVAWDKVCKIWKHIEITSCKDYPITPIQLWLDNLEGKCRYYW